MELLFKLFLSIFKANLAAEFLIRLTSDVNRQSIPAISLAQDTSTLTACINDYGPDDIFKRVFTRCSQSTR